MENHLKFKIYWLNVILNANFLDHVELGLLKEVSMLSKAVREKLKPRLFRNLELSSHISEFEFKDNIFIEYVNWQTDQEFNDLSNDYYRYLKGLSVENGLNDFTRSLKHIKKYTKSFYFKDAKKAEHYLFPVINAFDNLNTLRLKSCNVPLFAFNKIGESLLNLKRLEMDFVKLYKSSTESFKSKMFILPSNLEYLDIRLCYVGRCNMLSDPYKIILNEYLKVIVTKLDLPKVSIPTLKFLGYQSFDRQSNWDFYQFLAKNRNLESLKIKSSCMSDIQELKSLKCLELIDADHIYIDEQTSALKNIVKLSVDKVYPQYYEDIKNMCSLCPNLQNLRLNMRIGGHVTSFIDIFILPLLSNFSLLKTLELRFIAKKDEKFDFKNVKNIESLIIETESFTILNISFDTCYRLKKVKLVSNSGEVNTQEFKDKFNSYNNWKFKFVSNTIKGYKTI